MPVAQRDLGNASRARLTGGTFIKRLGLVTEYALCKLDEIRVVGSPRLPSGGEGHIAKGIHTVCREGIDESLQTEVREARLEDLL